MSETAGEICSLRIPRTSAHRSANDAPGFSTWVNGRAIAAVTEEIGPNAVVVPDRRVVVTDRLLGDADGCDERVESEMPASPEEEYEELLL